MLLMSRLDQVLTEGGLIKAAFHKKGGDAHFFEKNEQGFADACRTRGYDVYVQNVSSHKVLLARKPYTSIPDHPVLAMQELSDLDTTLKEADIKSIFARPGR